jgi:hypothetical protein
MFAFLGYSGTCYAFGGITVFTGILVFILFPNSKITEEPLASFIENEIRIFHSVIVPSTSKKSLLQNPSSDITTSSGSVI